MNNIGFSLTAESDCHCFHDVDYLPLWADYTYFRTPTRLIWYGIEARTVVLGRSEQSVSNNPDIFFGGVVLRWRGIVPARGPPVGQRGLQPLLGMGGEPGHAIPCELESLFQILRDERMPLPKTTCKVETMRKIVVRLPAPAGETL